jgi:hypothetical protein
MEVRDVVVIFADAPFVIRLEGEHAGDYFLLIGEAYVHGLILGELDDQCPEFIEEDVGYRNGLQRFCLRWVGIVCQGCVFWRKGWGRVSIINICISNIT